MAGVNGLIEIHPRLDRIRRHAWSAGKEEAPEFRRGSVGTLAGCDLFLEKRNPRLLVGRQTLSTQQGMSEGDRCIAMAGSYCLIEICASFDWVRGDPVAATQIEAAEFGGGDIDPSR